MIMYISNRSGGIIAEYSHFYNDKHHRELTAGASTLEFDVDNSLEDTSALVTGNGVVIVDLAGRDWYFVILTVDRDQDSCHVYAEDASIELMNEVMDPWATTEAHPFSYYADMILENTPWRIATDQTIGKSRKLIYTGEDTGLGRLLSIAAGFDDVELEFKITISGMQITDYYINVLERVGVDRTHDIQLVYNREVDNIKRSESRVEFVTSLKGIGSVIQPPADSSTTVATDAPEQHVDFSSIEYDDGTFRSPKGSPWLYADKANREFNEGTHYIPKTYSFDTDSPQELFNRTLSQLKTYSEPAVSYEVSVSMFDESLSLGDTTDIIDHEFPSLYLQARVAIMDISYTAPETSTIQFANYIVLNDTLAEQLATLQLMIQSVPSNAAITVIRNTINNLSGDVDSVRQQAILALTSANGKNSNYYGSLPPTANEGDTGFIDNADGTTTIWVFKNGKWEVEVGDATGEEIKKAVKQAMADTAAAKAAAQSAVDQANNAVAAAGFASNMAQVAGSQALAAQSQAKSLVAVTSQNAIDLSNTAKSAGSAISQAGTAIASASAALSQATANKTSLTSQSTAISSATNAILLKANQTDLNTVKQTVTSASAQLAVTAAAVSLKADQTTTDALQKTLTSQASQLEVANAAIQLKADKTVTDTLKQSVTSNSALLAVTAAGLQLKADATAVDNVKGTVASLSTQVQAQAGQISAKLNSSDLSGLVAGMGYATQNWAQNAINVSASGLNASISSVTNQLNNLSVGSNNLILNTSNITTLDHWNQDGWMSTNGTLTLNKHDYYHGGQDNLIRLLSNNGKNVSVKSDRFYVKPNTTYTFQVKGFNNGNVKNPTIYFLSRPKGSTSDYTNVREPIDGSQQFGPWGLVENSARFQTASDDFEGYIRVDNPGTTDGASGSFWFVEAKMAEGNVVPDYSPASGDSATQTDMLAVKANANQINVQLSSVIGDLATAKTDITNINVTAKGLATTVSNNSGNIANLQAQANGFQATISNKVDQNQLTALASQFTSKISGLGGINLVPNSGNMTSNAGWSSTAKIVTHPYYKNGAGPLFQISNATSSEIVAGSPRFKIKRNTTYTLSFTGFASSNVLSMDFFVLGRPAGETKDFTIANLVIGGRRLSPSYAENIVVTFNSGAIDEAYVRLDNNGSTDGKNSVLLFTDIQIEEGTVATPWKPSTNDFASETEVAQTRSDINARVKVGDVVNQINIDPTGILIDGKKVHITGQTTIDNGIINSAMIQDASISSAKIVDGAIVNAKIANLDVNKLTGNMAQFLSTMWASAYGNVGISGLGMTVATSDLSKPWYTKFDRSGITLGMNVDDHSENVGGFIGMAKVGNTVVNGPYMVLNKEGTPGQPSFHGDEMGLAVSSGTNPDGTAAYSPILQYDAGTGLNPTKGFTFNDKVSVQDFHTKTLYSTDDGTGLWFDRGNIGSVNGIMLREAGRQGGIFWGDDGELFIGTTGKWFSIWTILNKIGIS